MGASGSVAGGGDGLMDVIFCQQDTASNDEDLEQERATTERDLSRKTALNDMQEHLEAFLNTSETPSYEAWIADLHPENGTVGEDGTITIDPRMYVMDSDHRIMWNENPRVSEAQQVAPSNNPLPIEAAAETVAEKEGSEAQAGAPKAEVTSDDGVIV